MNYVHRMWIAASVAVVQGHTDQGKWKSGRRSLQLDRRRFSGGESTALRPLAGAIGTGLFGLKKEIAGYRESPMGTIAGLWEVQGAPMSTRRRECWVDSWLTEFRTDEWNVELWRIDCEKGDLDCGWG
ncbi:hypothetical protein TIFTF001_030280 [Ficus carica]|uniref:Uncharacterized protein n=1 Tax=Ficus carica TaxID=3494 RepID=A0AA88J3J5_FICCA|nr:hypothetical protein TIFTF001_030280 [Ficus carica]